MNKLILLNEVREEKIKFKNKLISFSKDNTKQEEYLNSYVSFKEKFNFINNEEVVIKSDNGNGLKDNNIFEKNLNKIIAKVFSLKNHKPLIDLINSIYNDDLGPNTEIKYIKNRNVAKDNEEIISSNNYNFKILAEDEYKKIEYKIEFETKDEQNIGIIINKRDLSNNYNVVSLNKKRKQYINENNFSYDYNKCLIMLNSNIEIPDEYEFTIDSEGNEIACKVNVIKSWKYGFKQLFENNMYLLLPFKIIDLIKIASWVSNNTVSKEQVKDEMIRFYKDMNRYFSRAKDENLVTDKDINELNLIASSLLEQVIRDKNDILLEIKREIEIALKDIVV